MTRGQQVQELGLQVVAQVQQGVILDHLAPGRLETARAPPIQDLLALVPAQAQDLDLDLDLAQEIPALGLAIAPSHLAPDPPAMARGSLEMVLARDLGMDLEVDHLVMVRLQGHLAMGLGHPEVVRALAREIRVQDLTLALTLYLAMAPVPRVEARRLLEIALAQVRAMVLALAAPERLLRACLYLHLHLLSS